MLARVRKDVFFKLILNIHGEYLEELHELHNDYHSPLDKIEIKKINAV